MSNMESQRTRIDLELHNWNDGPIYREGDTVERELDDFDTLFYLHLTSFDWRGWHSMTAHSSWISRQRDLYSGGN